MISRFNPSIIYKDGKFTITVREASYAKYETSLNVMNTQFSLNRKFYNRLYITTCNDIFNDELQWNKVTTKSRQNDMFDKLKTIIRGGLNLDKLKKNGLIKTGKDTAARI